MTNLIEKAISLAGTFVPMLATVAVVIALLALINWSLKRRWQDKPDAQFRFQLIMLALTFSGFLAVVLVLPVSTETRGQVLSLIGILLSAAIALSSTTFIGNIMAGIMLKAVRSARPGDFITIEDLTGRITEMGLLHTRVQTEFRDLVTVPNLYMVTRPTQVVRQSGTIITAEVSLGYDVSHADVERILCAAAERAGLGDGFVHVRELGDYSVTYRVAGLLEDVKSLISARSHLREAMLDALHEAGIEIVSPNFMNTRALSPDTVLIPEQSRKKVRTSKTAAEDVAFDIADEAASAEQIRKSMEQIDARIEAVQSGDGEPDAATIDRLKARRSRLVEQLEAAEARKKQVESEG